MMVGTLFVVVWWGIVIVWKGFVVEGRRNGLVRALHIHFGD
jgi:hypothetical protein